MNNDEILTQKTLELTELYDNCKVTKNKDTDKSEEVSKPEDNE